MDLRNASPWPQARWARLPPAMAPPFQSQGPQSTWCLLPVWVLKCEHFWAPGSQPALWKTGSSSTQLPPMAQPDTGKKITLQSASCRSNPGAPRGLHEVSHRFLKLHLVNSAGLVSQKETTAYSTLKQVAIFELGWAPFLAASKPF